MKILIYTIIAILFCAFASCGKKKTIIVKFTDVVTGEGIPDIEFSIRKGKTCLSYDGCGSKVVATGTTDVEGQEGVSFRQNGNNNYFVSYPNAESFGYYILDGSLSVLDINDGEIKEIKLLPSCQLHLSFNNINCYDSNDAISYEFETEYGNISFIPNPIVGCSGQQFETATVRAGNTILNYTVTRNGVSEDFSETFNLEPFEENEIIINY